MKTAWKIVELVLNAAGVVSTIFLIVRGEKISKESVKEIATACATETSATVISELGEQFKPIDLDTLIANRAELETVEA